MVFCRPRGLWARQAERVDLAYLVCFVHLVSLVRPNKPNRPNKQKKPAGSREFRSRLRGARYGLV
jgi:hypothetical protein